MTLIQLIPSHMVVAGHRTLISYEGQPTICYGCNEPGHLYTACPHRRRAQAENRQTPTRSWVEVAAKGPTQFPPTAAVEDTRMAVLENTDTDTQHATDDLLAPPIEERNQRERKLFP